MAVNALVRQLSALSVLWALCELLLPDGRQLKLARLTVSALVMASLVSGLGGLLQKPVELNWSAPALAAYEPDEAEYARAALVSMANQAEGLCERVASRAGYDAAAAVYLRRDGSLSHVELRLWQSGESPPLMTQAEVVSTLATLLQAEESAIHLMDGAMNE